MKLTLQQLKVFSAIASKGNLGAAADALFITKGAVSQNLQQLESQLATQLFDRVHPRLQLNSEGRRLQPMVDEVLARVDDIQLQFSGQNQPVSELRLGASQTIGNYLLPKLLAHHAPQQLAHTQVVIANSQQLCDKVSHFELDMALIEGQNTHQQLQATPWRKDHMCVVAAAQHPLAAVKKLSLNALNQQPWILRELASGSREQFELHLRPNLPDIQSVLELGSLEAVMLAVEQGLGLTFISQLAAETRLASGKLVALKLDQQFERQLFMVWHKNKYLGGNLQRFIDNLREQTAQ
ncbi:LysR family transcriptional regulator [Neptunicella marina]|uniref:LysR family transcriptional regulator n=1 Tax=Neptunicella marina TaxID=2125989 RepID=A0A8J6IUL4_9ALTE|nr:LysR family transcriptional regulator [Neptunicella marina]MBC3766140.1 LysR family transcriptional regulator [Neptunicella marina]